MNSAITPQHLLDRLHWRYATKQFDPARKIAAGDWAALEETLALAPSSGGLQPWKFVVVTDPAVREKLLPVSYGQRQVVDASHLVVLAAKQDFGEADVDAHLARTAAVRGIPIESLAAYRGMMVGGIVNAMDDTARRAWAARQVGIALGTLLTGAALLGIDACPMEGFVPAEYDALLGLKEQGYSSVAICPLGYRAETDPYATLPKVRFAQEDLFLRV